MSEARYPPAPPNFLKPKIVTVKTQEGDDKTFMISKFDAILGREMVAKYPVANMPKIGEYAVSEACMFKLMTCVAALSPDGKLWYPLESSDFYRNHVPDWETGGKLEGAMWEYNCSFFASDKASIFFGDIIQNFKRWVMSMLTDSLVELSRREKQP